MRRILLIGLVLMMTLVACGGDDEESQPAPPTTVPTDPPRLNPTLPPEATVDVRASRPTLPPVWTPTQDDAAPPAPTLANATPTAAIPLAATIIEPTRPPACQTFRPDFERNRLGERIEVGQPVTIYWFPVEAEGVEYLVQLYGPFANVVLTEGVTQTEFTFSGDLFTRPGSRYSWTVVPNQNGAPMGCGSIDDEIFVTR